MARSFARLHVGAFALIAALLGSTACATNPSSDDGQTTTSNGNDTVTDVSTNTDESDVTTGDDSLTDTDDPSTSFYAGPTDVISVDECDPFAQDCPDGEKCVPKADEGPWWEINACVPVLGDGGVGDPCSYGGPLEGTDDCDADTLCWNPHGDDGVAVGTCVPFCSGTADDPICEVEGTACMISNQGSINLCLQHCHPLEDGCPVGEACAWVRNDFYCHVPLAPGMQGDTCEHEPVDCNPGVQCVPAEALSGCEGTGCCTSYCDITADPGPCVELGLVCVGMFENAQPPPGYEDVGLCLTPP